MNVTWFLRVDEQMEAYGLLDWALRQFSGTISDLEGKGDEFGLHFHSYRRNKEKSGWHQDYVDERWLGEALEAAVSTYATALGRRPRYFRFGDCWLSEAVVSQLESLGIEYDLTLEPGRAAKRAAEPDIGFHSDYTRMPRRPYRASHGNFLEPDAANGRNLWMLPVSTSCLAHPGHWHPGDREPHRIGQLNLGFDPGFILPFIDSALRSRQMVVTVARTGDLDWPGCSLLANLDFLLGHPQLNNFVIEPPASALERFLQSDRAGRRWSWSGRRLLRRLTTRRQTGRFG